MIRLNNWQNNLTKLIEKYRDKPFDFEKHNCLLWAGLGVKAVTGKNPVSHIIGKYKTEKGALTYLKKIEKVTSSQQLLQKYLNEEDRAIAFARIGDIVLVDPDKLEDLSIPVGHLFGKIPGICYGQTSFFVGEQGLVQIETLRLDSCLWVS